MISNDQEPVNGKATFGFSLRDVVTILFRHKRVVVLSFMGILTGAVLAAVLHAPEYRASTKFLIERERLDPVISPGQSTPPEARGEVTEEELNSEVELIESADVLRQVVVSCGLHQKRSFLRYLFGAGDESTRIARAANRLQSELKIEVVRKSNVISVSYTAERSPVGGAGTERPRGCLPEKERGGASAARAIRILRSGDGGIPEESGRCRVKAEDVLQRRWGCGPANGQGHHAAETE